MNYAHLKRNVQITQRQPVPPAPQMKGFVDRRPEFAAQRKLINGIQNSSGVAQCSLKIGEKVYDIKKGKYRVNGKEVKDYQFVITEIRKNVEETTKEKTETGEKKYKWDDNWNNIVADFVECEKIVKFSNIGEFASKIEATIIEDSTKLGGLLENLSAVKMIRPLAEMMQEESVLKKTIDDLCKSIKETKNKIGLIEKEGINLKDPTANSSSGGDVSKLQESIKETCSETMGQKSKEKTAEKEELNKNLNSLVLKCQTLNENLLNLANEKGTRQNITECWKILKKYPLQKEKRRQLFNVEKNLAEQSPKMNDTFLPPTWQMRDTTMCWFLSVFEGLRRAKLVYPIIERLIDDLNSESIFSNFSGLQDWQLLLERKFMRYNGLLKLTKHTFRPNTSLNGVEDNQIMAAFFNGIDPKFPGVLAGYKYLLEQDISLHINNAAGDSGLALKNLPKEGGIQKDSKKISFYTVDKPGHAMFYLGISSYDDNKKGEEKYVKDKINKLNLSYENELKQIDDVPKFAELKQVKIFKEKKQMTIAEKNSMKAKRTELKAERGKLKELAKSQLINELGEIGKIPITGYKVHVYNQSHRAEETYRLGQIVRIQKHSFKK